MNIIQIELHNSLKNFNYIIELENKTAWCIDPLDSKKIIIQLEEKQLKLIGIINTHSHFDHIAGNSELQEKYNCELYTPKYSNIQNSTHQFEDEEELNLDIFTKLKFVSTPGHMNIHYSVIFINQNINECIFTGDSVFIAGIGNCRDGSVEKAYDTITQVYSQLDNSLLIYCGHNYALTNLKFSQYIEPINEFRDNLLKKFEDGENIITTLGDERRINPFFRTDNEQIKRRVEKLIGREINSEKDLFF